jgi:ElaB/YqjD/DUF883 family membrane-anchored ribosome-binding protein
MAPNLQMATSRRSNALDRSRRINMANPADSPLGSSSTAKQVQQQVEGFAEAASEYCSDLSEQLRLCTESAEKYIRKQPIKSLLIAAGVGVLIGLVARR